MGKEALFPPSPDSFVQLAEQTLPLSFLLAHPFPPPSGGAELGFLARCEMCKRPSRSLIPLLFANLYFSIETFFPLWLPYLFFSSFTPLGCFAFDGPSHPLVISLAMPARTPPTTDITCISHAVPSSRPPTLSSS